MAKFCWSIKDCQSQASFNDCTIKGPDQKMLAYRVFASGGGRLGDPPSRLCLPPSRLCPTPQKFPENNRKTIASPHHDFVPPSRSCPPTKISRKQWGQQQPIVLKQYHIVNNPP